MRREKIHRGSRKRMRMMMMMIKKLIEVGTFSYARFMFAKKFFLMNAHEN